MIASSLSPLDDLVSGPYGEVIQQRFDCLYDQLLKDTSNLTSKPVYRYRPISKRATSAKVKPNYDSSSDMTSGYLTELEESTEVCNDASSYDENSQLVGSPKFKSSGTAFKSNHGESRSSARTTCSTHVIYNSYPLLPENLKYHNDESKQDTQSGDVIVISDDEIDVQQEGNKTRNSEGDSLLDQEGKNESKTANTSMSKSSSWSKEVSSKIFYLHKPKIKRKARSHDCRRVLNLDRLWKRIILYPKVDEVKDEDETDETAPLFLRRNLHKGKLYYFQIYKRTLKDSLAKSSKQKRNKSEKDRRRLTKPAKPDNSDLPAQCKASLKKVSDRYKSRKTLSKGISIGRYPKRKSTSPIALTADTAKRQKTDVSTENMCPVKQQQGEKLLVVSLASKQNKRKRQERAAKVATNIRDGQVTKSNTQNDSKEQGHIRTNNGRRSCQNKSNSIPDKRTQILRNKGVNVKGVTRLNRINSTQDDKKSHTVRGKCTSDNDSVTQVSPVICGNGKNKVLRVMLRKETDMSKTKVDLQQDVCKTLEIQDKLSSRTVFSPTRRGKDNCDRPSTPSMSSPKSQVSKIKVKNNASPNPLDSIDQLLSLYPPDVSSSPPPVAGVTPIIKSLSRLESKLKEGVSTRQQISAPKARIGSLFSTKTHIGAVWKTIHDEQT